MRLKFVISFLLTLCFSCTLFSQDRDTKPVNYKKLRKEINKKRSPFYYPVLYQRYTDLDTSLTTEEFRYLYYGFSLQDDYAPYNTPPLRDSLIRYLSRSDLMQEEYMVTARIGSALLAESPFRLRETFITALSFEISGDTRLSAAYFKFYEKQVDAIMSTGDGLTTNSAFSVIYIQDEYEIMEVLGFKFGGGQYLLNGGFDMLELEQNRYGVDALYFDVSRLLATGTK